jgi:hypothetical protein
MLQRLEIHMLKKQVSQTMIDIPKKFFRQESAWGLSVIRINRYMRKILYPLLLCLCTSCSELMLLSSGAGVVASQSPLVKAYNGADMITILSTDTDIKGHAYNSIKPKRKPIFNDND